ncbi:MAG: response regulator [Bdellovibrionales bacterium]|nr:response regulator [Bdellovibrionales bacterium]
MSPRVLVVDDEELLGKALARAFQIDGWESETSNGAAAALRVLGAGPPFDAVIVDFLMPDMHGTEVLRWLAAHHPRTKRFLMTAQLDFAREASADGLAHAVFQKPFANVLDLPKTVRPFLPCE